MTKRFSALGIGALLLIGAGCGNNPDKAYEAARNAAAKGDCREAFRLAEKAEKTDPKNRKGLLLLAVVAEKCGEHDRALDAARRAVQLDERDFTAQYTLGRICAARTDRRAEGLKILQRAHELNPGDVRTMVLIADTALAMNHPRTPRFLLELQKCKGYEKSAELYNDLGIAYMRLGQYAEARSAFTSAQEFGAGNPRITLNIARFFDYHTTHAYFAETLYRKFLRQAGNRREFRAEADAVRRRLQER
ncbi:MAG: tetratricopeptide repeat protein [Victivallaceae bacterium]|nr:tetratricopeptide repeat protein [Victivallaceae bacterium]